MKKHKLILLFVLGVFLVLQAGCKKAPQVTHEDAATAIQEEFQLLIGNDAEITNPVIATLSDGFSVEIISISSKEDAYTVKCILSNYDTIAAFEASKLIEGEMSLEEYAQLMVDVLTQQERCKMETQIPLIVLDDGRYQVTFNEEQLDAALGGFISYYNQLLEEVVE